MFRFRKNFSIRESPSKSNITPIKLANKVSSPFRLTSKNSPNKNVTTTTNGTGITTSRISFKDRLTSIGSSLMTSDRANLTEVDAPVTDLVTSNSINCSTPLVDRLKSINGISAVAATTSVFTESSYLKNPASPSRKRIKLSLEDVKAQKEAKLTELNEKVADKIKQIQGYMIKTCELRKKRAIINDCIQIVSKSQYDVRNQLNQIYYPGNEFAQAAKSLICEKRRNHANKFETIEFELTELIEGCQSAIEAKKKQLIHQVELHERTLMSIQSAEKKAEKNAVQIKTGTEIEQVASEEVETIINEDKSKDQDDDCIIIDDQTHTDVDLTEQDHEETCNIDVGIDQNKSENTTNSLVPEEEEEQDTDIDEDQLTDEERSFTPCQAQRPLN